MADPILILGIPLDFILFGFILFGIALFHRHTLTIALSGLAVIISYKIGFTGFKFGTGVAGLGHHMEHEWVTLANLFLLLMGFALLSRHFEESRIPDEMPALLPDDWKGGVILLVIVFVLSSFLDNIAGALIGGTVARHVFRGKVHIGYLAAIVAASNAGGSGSVVGDTTTTMMWIDGISPLSVLEAYVAAIVALMIFAIPAAIQQHRFSPVVKKPPGRRGHSDRGAGRKRDRQSEIPGPARYAARARARRLGGDFDDGVLAHAGLDHHARDLQGNDLLLALVTAASMMPVETLPAASWPTALGLGFVSAAFDNIPLTALALKQGGYDWGFLAYAVGFGGSMIWFGSSAGVALSNMYPEAKSVGLWVRNGWPIAVAYVVGFFVMLAVIGWHPDPPH